ncbi:Pyruvate decarboxylase isozyme 2 [Triticum urartu]|uniref:pyruvate decarboxylase n=1 Tax=Triticum urartu TaxID=4572 RepID=M7ZNR3_TRIUA|nr:Pyruvate decarboxylase isozyme 2 [Triticum urartu]
MDNGIGSVDRPKAVGNGMVACPAVFHTSSLAPTIPSAEATLGSHLARRLVEVGVSDVFAVPGDFNLTLLDHLIAEPGLRLVSCCNELNAGYAADGYARAKGVGTCAVTFTVGGLSVLNAIAGAYSENLPRRDRRGRRLMVQLPEAQKLPDGCGYEFQMQYGSIGCSVGALLGYAQAAMDKRVIACIGDGSFQMTAREVSTMLRCQQKSIIFLINNGGYSIEVAIHDGPYNVIKNWNYTGLVDDIHNGEGTCWTAKATCEEELTAAIETAKGKHDCLCFIEVVVHKDDTSKELLEWGSRVGTANSRPPNPH